MRIQSNLHRSEGHGKKENLVKRFCTQQDRIDGGQPQGNRSTGAEEDLHCRSEAEHESAGAKEVNSTLRCRNWCITWDTGGPDCSVLEHRVQLEASHGATGASGGNAEDSNKDEQGSRKHRR